MGKRWSEAPAARHQLTLFSPSCDELISPDAAVRSLDAFLIGEDWSSWESHYDGYRGQPPIHPRLLAGSLLYGLLHGIRSTRRLEEATRVRLDFIWLLEGRAVDHSTFALFRREFGAELKVLNRRLSQILRRGLGDPLVELVIDGTRIRSNSSRTGARTAGSLERGIGQCEQRLNALLDDLEDDSASEVSDAAALERQLDVLERRRAQLYRALDTARQRDETKRKKEGAKAAAARVPVTDPDSMILPNKDGGYAPNFTAAVAVDKATGAIVEAAEETYQANVERVLADSNFASGDNLAYLDERRTEAYMPTGVDLRPSNPANRADPTKPVAEPRRKDLPRAGGRLAQSAFVYQEENDRYYCPMGKALRRAGKPRGGAEPDHVRYRCGGARDCPMAQQCVKGDVSYRTILRERRQPLREQTARRMATEEGQKIYSQRAPSVEGVFGAIKHNMGIRQFLLRGKENVRVEWNWICAAFNLKKLLAERAATNQRAPGRPSPRASRLKIALYAAAKLLGGKNATDHCLHLGSRRLSETIG